MKTEISSRLETELLHLNTGGGSIWIPSEFESSNEAQRAWSRMTEATLLQAKRSDWRQCRVLVSVPSEFESSNEEPADDPLEDHTRSHQNLWDFLSPLTVIRNPRLEEIEQAINRAKETILPIVNDWDGESTFSYAEETIDAAATFLRQLVQKTEIPEMMAVRISPSGQGSIDLHWRQEQFELLVNFLDGGSGGTYYGDDYKGNSIQGEDSIPKPGFIACWMESLVRDE